MDYLSREDAPVDGKLWNRIDKTVVDMVSRVLCGRKFIPLFGPLGIGVTHVAIDNIDELDEVAKNGMVMTSGRKVVELPIVYEDFLLSAKDLASAAHDGYPADLGKVATAAENCALKEDKLIFFGNNDFAIEGLFNAAGTNKIKRTDWTKDENAFTNIAAAMNVLIEKGIYGGYTLVVSPDLYLQMQRLQPGTGLLEIDRVKKLLSKRVYVAPVLGKNKAVMVCPDSRYMDLAIGQDLKTGYLEQVNLNHHFRLMETIRLRIKKAQAIVVLE